MSRQQVLHYLSASSCEDLADEVQRAKERVARCVSASMVMRTALERFLSMSDRGRDVALKAQLRKERS